jgi:hypothetical protein
MLHEVDIYLFISIYLSISPYIYLSIYAYLLILLLVYLFNIYVFIYLCCVSLFPYFGNYLLINYLFILITVFT